MRWLRVLGISRTGGSIPDLRRLSGPPRHFLLATGMFPPNRRLCHEISRGTIKRISYLPEKSVQHRQPNASEWLAFWRMIDHCGVCRWLPEYRPGRIPGMHRLDGAGWRLALRVDDFWLECSGWGNTYPQLGQPHLSTRSPEALHLLQSWLGSFVNRSRAFPPDWHAGWPQDDLDGRSAFQRTAPPPLDAGASGA